MLCRKVYRLSNPRSRRSRATQLPQITPSVARNIGVGALVGGVGVGVFAAVNIVGFPEVEIGEGIGAILGGLSALGDPGLIFLNYGAYGATAGGIAGYVSTPAQCGGH